MTDPVPPQPVRPWWAAVLTSALTTLFGLALIVVAVLVVRPALGDADSGIWIGLVLGGAGMTGVGGSLLGRNPVPPDQRGYIVHGALVGLVLLGLLTLGWASAGCGSRQVVAEHSVQLRVKRGPPCLLSLEADGEEVCSVRSATERCGVSIDGEVQP